MSDIFEHKNLCRERRKATRKSFKHVVRALVFSATAQDHKCRLAIEDARREIEWAYTFGRAIKGNSRGVTTIPSIFRPLASDPRWNGKILRNDLTLNEFHASGRGNV